MASREGFQELVMLFDPAGSKVELEMRLGQFNGLLAQKGTLDSHAASTVKAAYAQVGAGLALRAAVFFLFKVNDQGYVDPAFNLPLEYMAHHAGAGPDVGTGPVSMACRSQCPVPWHAINMWEPAAEAQQHPVMLVQKTVWRNRLGLKAMPATSESRVARIQPPPVSEAPHIELGQAANGSIGGRRQSLEDKLTAAFGEAGRVSTARYARQHREQAAEADAGTRAEVERQQQVYLDQIRSYREEVQQLKAALRHEQRRNRRLQQLLRGDV